MSVALLLLRTTAEHLVFVGLSLVVLRVVRGAASGSYDARYRDSVLSHYFALWIPTLATLAKIHESVLPGAIWPFGVLFGLDALWPSWERGGGQAWVAYSLCLVGGLGLAWRLGVWLDGKAHSSSGWLRALTIGGIALGMTLAGLSWGIYALGRSFGIGRFFE